MPIPISATISGSRSGSVLGQNEYGTQLDVWMDIMEDLDPGFAEKNGYGWERFEGNASTDFGHAFESATIALTEQKTGLKIIDQERVFEKRLYPQMNNLKNPMMMSCHVDGIFSGFEQWKHREGNLYELVSDKVLYEGKTAFDMGFRKKWDIEKDLIPRSYNLQCQHNMYLADLQEAIVSVLVFPKHPQDLVDEGWEVHEYEADKYRIIRKDDSGIVKEIALPLKWTCTLNQMGYHHIFKIKRNDDLIKAMLEKYQEFWERFVIPRKPPEAMNFDDIKKLCPSPHGTVVLDQDKDKNIISWINEIRGINKEIGTAGLMPKRKKELTTTVMNYVKDMPAVLEEENTNKLEIKDGQGFTIATYSKQKDEKRVFRVSK